MVLLAAAVCNKAGKAIISRQFVEMTKSRIEGLLAAFPKLMGTGKQHTFVETDSVRYVYQPMEKLYMVLITTKASNILEDLETLRLFARVINEYCKVLDESCVSDQAFSLIFAFDEIVALGYRESVNLQQIRTFTDMDSHEERVYLAVREAQMKDAKKLAREKEKEFRAKRRENQLRGEKDGGGGYGYGGFGSGGGGGAGSHTEMIVDNVPADAGHSRQTKPLSKSIALSGRGAGGMKLGSKAKDVDQFVDQLRTEGQDVVSPSTGGAGASVQAAVTPATNRQSVHITREEKITLSASRDGGIHSLEVTGMLTLRISDSDNTRICLLIQNNDIHNVVPQTHPNVDKKLFAANSMVAAKGGKAFPVNQELGMLRWKFQSQDETCMPLTINCWPSEVGGGKCEVNIEYELENERLELTDVSILIPTATGHGQPTVNNCDGQYHYEKLKGILEWKIPLIDANNKSGAMEFIMSGSADSFFPVEVKFTSISPFCDFSVKDVRLMETKQAVNFSDDSVFHTERYEIV